MRGRHSSVLRFSKRQQPKSSFVKVECALVLAYERNATAMGVYIK